MNGSNFSMRSSNQSLNASMMSLSSSVMSGGWFFLDEFRAMKGSLRREPESILAHLVEEDFDPEQMGEEFQIISFDNNSGRWQIDANPDYFEYILKYLRTGKFNDVRPGHSLEDLRDEAECLKLSGLVDICQRKIEEQKQFMRSGMSTPSTIPASATPSGYFYPGYHHGSQQFYPPPGIPMPPSLMAMGPPPGFESNNSRPMSATFQQSRSESTNSSQQSPQMPEMLPQQQQQPFQAPVATSTPEAEKKTNPALQIQQQFVPEHVNESISSGMPLPPLPEEPPVHEIGPSDAEFHNLNFNDVDETLSHFSLPVTRPTNLNPPWVGPMQEVVEENFARGEYGDDENGLEMAAVDEQEERIQNGGNDEMWEETNEHWETDRQEANENSTPHGQFHPNPPSHSAFSSPQSGNDYPEIPDQMAAASPLNRQVENNSTIFLAPDINLNYCPLIDIESLSPAKVPPFEVQNGQIQNFMVINKQRTNYVNRFLQTLKGQTQEFIKEQHNNWADNLGKVLFFLQRLHVRFPNGCTIDQYCDYENCIRLERQGHYDLTPTVVSLLDMNDPDSLLWFDREGRLQIASDVLGIHLFCLRQNLCSNLYRFLTRQKQIQGKDLLAEMKLMVPPSSPPLGPDCLLCILNRYPAIFTLAFHHEQTNYTLETGWIRLNEALVSDPNLKWRIVLDCDVSNLGVEFCECGKC